MSISSYLETLKLVAVGWYEFVVLRKKPFNDDALDISKKQNMKVFAIGSPVLCYQSAESGLKIPGKVVSRDILSSSDISYKVSLDTVNEILVLPSAFVLATEDSIYEEIEI